MRGDLPTGTVTFLFTDVEGSTRLLHELGAEAYASALTEHRRIVREACSAHGCVEVDTQGDAFFVAFPTAPGALAAAWEMTDALASGPIQVRIGLHTGTPLVTEEGYVGDDVHFAARVAASGHGGQILVSSATAAFVGPSDTVSQSASLSDLGEHRLKDIAEPVAIFQLGTGSFPPLKTISNTNLPRPASSFVGRERELAEVLAKVESGARLLTFTGPGGSGKTRLAIEAAASLVPEYKAGVFWVGLASLRDAALVTETIAQTLGAKDGLAEHIAERELFLLIDNLEQLIEAAPELSALLAACPNLTLLVTSRELLRVQGEVEYPVPPLAESEAVSLFCARSQLEPSDEIAELCTGLDNLPLAVELAAARTKALSAAQILERLSQRLDLLKGRRDADPRQQTLRATIEWSYDLLSEEEKQLFRNLSVFAGGCTLEAAEEVCEADLDTLQSLVEKSLLRFSNERYWMLETIREYASERLETGAAGELRRRHAEFFLEVARAANLTEGSEGVERLDVAVSEQDNLRAAIDWAAGADRSLALRLAIALEQFWVIRSPFEGILRFEALSPDLAGDVPADLRAAALRAWGGSTFIVGRFDEGTELYRRSLAAYRGLGDELGIAMLLHRLSVSAMVAGDLKRARALAEESGVLFERAKFGKGTAQVLTTLGDIAFEEGDHERSLELLERGAALAGETGFVWWQAGTLLGLAERAYTLGRHEDANLAAREALAIASAIGERQLTVFSLAGLARVAAAAGDFARAGRLWGAVEREEEKGPVGQWETEREAYSAAVFAYADPAFERARAQGRALTLESAVEDALQSID